jgi:DNA-binding CsgD family transcriptional regulator
MEVSLRTHQCERRRQLRRAADHALQRMGDVLASLEHVGDGVLLLDGLCRVVYLTNSACRLLETCKGSIRLRDRRLLFEAKENTCDFAAFAQWVQEYSPPADAGETFFIKRPPPRQPLILSAFPLPSPAFQEDSAAARMLVILRDPDHQPAVQWQAFAQQFQLTAAELRLCVAWANGLTLSEYSEKFHVSSHTARSQLKSVFDKTDTHRQVQLLRLIFAFVHP